MYRDREGCAWARDGSVDSCGRFVEFTLPFVFVLFILFAQFISISVFLITHFRFLIDNHFAWEASVLLENVPNFQGDFNMWNSQLFREICENRILEEKLFHVSEIEISRIETGEDKQANLGSIKFDRIDYLLFLAKFRENSSKHAGAAEEERRQNNSTALLAYETHNQSRDDL
ncbi:hypothetical protein ACJX0J_033063, partial [Zea mays]